jgi:hypothetical protein
MPANSIHSGSSAFVAYGYEAIFAQGASKTFMFGKEQKANSLEFQNSQQPLGQLYTPEIQHFLYKKNHGGCTMEYILSNPWMFASVLNDPAYSAGSPDTHTFDSDPDQAGTTSTRNVCSMHMEVFQDGQTNGVDRNMKGVICPSLNIKTSIDAPVSCSQQLVWGVEDTVVTTKGTVPTETFTPYSFVHGSVELIDGGGTIANVQELDITFNTGAELVYGIDNSPNASGAFRKLLNMTGKLTIALKDKVNIDRVMARTELADMRIVFTNGLTGDAMKKIDMLFTGIGLSRHGSQGIAPGELLTEIVDFQCRNVVVVASNDSTDQFI